MVRFGRLLIACTVACSLACVQAAIPRAQARLVAPPAVSDEVGANFHGPTYMDEHLLIRHVSSFGDVFEGYYLLKDLYTVAALVDADGNYPHSYAYTGYGLPTTIDYGTNGGCLPGDCDGDSTVDIADIPQFLTVLLEGPADLQEWCASDLNGDGLRDGEDVQPFVNCLLNAACAPAQASIANPFFFTGQRLDRFDAGDLLLYDFKARVFDPKHGRFQQRDPQEFADAYNLYEYALSHPTLGPDPTGNEFTILGLNVSTAISKGLQALNAYTAVTKGLQVVKALKSGVGVQQVLTGLIIEAALDRLGGKLFDTALKALGRFSGQFFSKLAKSLCCFVAGTLVETANGPTPIEAIQVGDWVLTRDQLVPDGPLSFRPVMQVFENIATETVWLTFADGSTLGTTPGHLIWTKEKGWSFAGDLVPGINLLGDDACHRTIVDIEIIDGSTATFNLEVAETETYFANGLWVHNTSCPNLSGFTKSQLRDKLKDLPGDQVNRLRDFFGTGLEGALDRLGNFDLPAGLTKEALQVYAEIAKRAIAEGTDKTGVQAARLALVREALDRLGG